MDEDVGRTMLMMMEGWQCPCSKDGGERYRFAVAVKSTGSLQLELANAVVVDASLRRSRGCTSLARWTRSSWCAAGRTLARGARMAGDDDGVDLDWRCDVEPTMTDATTTATIMIQMMGCLQMRRFSKAHNGFLGLVQIRG